MSETATWTIVAEYLLDTNHVTRLMALEEPITSRVRQAEAAGDRFGLSMTVLGELFYAVYASQQRARNLKRLQALTAVTLIWPFDDAAADVFGLIRAEQRVKGRPIPPLDAQIAAVARLHGLIVLTADHHFQFVTGISVEDWQA